MRERVLLLAAVSVGLASSAAAQPVMGALLDRLRSVDASKVTPADCEAQVAKSARLNAPDLLYAATVCYAAKQPVEGNFLLNAGQVRAIPDLDLMVPASKQDSDVGTSLYGVIFYYAGGPGDEEVLRQPASRDRLFKLFDAWSPIYAPDYDPGWRLRRRPNAAAYQAAIAEVRTARRKQLVDLARLYADPTYWSLDHRRQELQKRNPTGFAAGTPDATLLNTLMRQMDERAAALGVGGVGPSRDHAARVAAKVEFPPAAPASDETPANASGPVVKSCADQAERMTIAEESKIVGVLITQSPKWGVIWRADLAAENRPTERLTCTEHTTGSQPLEAGGDKIAPLPAQTPVQ